LNQQTIKYGSTLVKIRKEFAEFINRNKPAFKGRSIFSFAFPIENINLISLLNIVNKQFSDFLFYEKHDDNFSFIAIKKLIDLNINGDFSSLGEIVSGLKNSIINNWEDYELNNPPFITGGVKFDPERTSLEWNNFKTHHFFVPQILLLQKSGCYYLIYNFHTPEDANIFLLEIEFTSTVSSLLNFKSPGNGKKNFALEKNGAAKTDKNNWYDLVSKVTKKLDVNFKKVVLSRRIELDVKESIDWVSCFNSLEPEFPGCYMFMFKSNNAIFFGASPEKFISIQNNKIEIDALAGSARGKDTDTETELMTNKNIKEHKCVLDFIIEALSKYAKNIEIDSNLQVKKLKNVQHLHTKVNADLTSKADVLNLIEGMFPTPAVCGLPKLNAMEMIREIEKFDRGLFSGLTGWIDLEMNCEFTVAIRSALYCRNKLYLYAGAGIIEESIPEEEYAETEMKFHTILNLFNETSTG
jgi:menaquinone-specific isochorismate synthase